MEVPLEEGTKSSQGRRAMVCKQPACNTTRRGRTLEVEEGEDRLKRGFRFFLIIMQGRVYVVVSLWQCV